MKLAESVGAAAPVAAAVMDAEDAASASLALTFPPVASVDAELVAAAAGEATS